MADHQNPTPPQPALDPATALRQLIMGFRSTQLVRTAAELGLADHLADGPRTAADLAPLLKVDPTALHRLMRALASLGLLAEVGGCAYAATALSDCLRTGVTGSMRNYGSDIRRRLGLASLCAAALECRDGQGRLRRGARPAALCLSERARRRVWNVPRSDGGLLRAGGHCDFGSLRFRIRRMCGRCGRRQRRAAGSDRNGVSPPVRHPVRSGRHG